MTAKNSWFLLYSVQSVTAPALLSVEREDALPWVAQCKQVNEVRILYSFPVSRLHAHLTNVVSTYEAESIEWLTFKVYFLWGIPKGWKSLNIESMAPNLVVWLSGNVVGRFIEVTLHWGGLALIWVTVNGYTVLVFNKATHSPILLFGTGNGCTNMSLYIIFVLSRKQATRVETL